MFCFEESFEVFCFLLYEFNYLLSLLSHIEMGICILSEGINAIQLINNKGYLPHNLDCELLIIYIVKD